MRQSIQRSILAVIGVAILTYVARVLFHLNAPTVGFAYLLWVLIVATTWGFAEAAVSSVAATLGFNYFFLPPVGTLTIADPQNWVALFAFLMTSLIASRLSAKAERRAAEALERQQDLERLYTFSRSILLINDRTEVFPKQLARHLVEIFGFSAVVLYDRRGDQIYRAGPSDFDGLDDQLREAAFQGPSFSDAVKRRVITAVRLGSEPIASLALEGVNLTDSVLQGIANLVAIGLERARAQDMAHEIEAAKQSEQLRTTLIDAMAHEFKTPLTSIKAATTSLRADPDQPVAARNELISIADEEAGRLQALIDDSLEMARLDTAQTNLRLELADLERVVEDTVSTVSLDGRRLEVIRAAEPVSVLLDRRLIALALKQLVDNALKYSPPRTPITLRLLDAPESAGVEVIDRGRGIPNPEQSRVFDRFYRSALVKDKLPGSGLGLSIAQRIIHAHNGELTFSSRAGETVFRMMLPKSKASE